MRVKSIRVLSRVIVHPPPSPIVKDRSRKEFLSCCLDGIRLDRNYRRKPKKWSTPNLFDSRSHSSWTRCLTFLFLCVDPTTCVLEYHEDSVSARRKFLTNLSRNCSRRRTGPSALISLPVPAFSILLLLSSFTPLR